MNLIQTWLGNAFKGMLWLEHGGSLNITLTVPLKYSIRSNQYRSFPIVVSLKEWCAVGYLYSRHKKGNCLLEQGFKDTV